MESVRLGREIVALAVVVVVVVVIVVVWLSLSPSEESPPGQDYSDMLSSFESFPSNLWWCDNSVTLNEYLSSSVYEYILIDSNCEVLYSNRRCHRSPCQTFEVINAVESGVGMVVRDKTRNLAIRVSQNGMVRVVHISSP